MRQKDAHGRPHQHCISAKSEQVYISVSNTATDDVSVIAQVVSTLRSQLAELDKIKKERETLEGEIKAVTFDMSITFLTALSQDGAINEEQLSVTQLDQLYGAYNQRVQASLRAQEELLGQVQVYKHTSRRCYFRGSVFI